MKHAVIVAADKIEETSHILTMLKLTLDDLRATQSKTLRPGSWCKALGVGAENAYLIKGRCLLPITWWFPIPRATKRVTVTPSRYECQRC